MKQIANKRINPNGDVHPIDNEYVTGSMVMMIRTGDADLKTRPVVTGGSKSNDKVSDYFRSKRRRFEIQIQFKFKKAPTSKMYLSLEFEEPMKLNLFVRTSLNVLLRFCKMKLPLFSYLLHRKKEVSETDKQSGRYENLHFTCPAQNCLERIVVTKKGEIPPKLGDDIYEDPVSRNKRRYGGDIEYNTEDTYTISVYSEFLDFIQWKLSIPGLPKFSLTNFIAAQPLTVRAYSLLKYNNEEKRHLQSNISTLWLDVEMNNVGVTTLGKGAKRWIEKCIEEDDGESSTLSHQSFATFYSALDIEHHEDLYDQRIRAEVDSRGCCQIC